MINEELRSRIWEDHVGNREIILNDEIDDSVIEGIVMRIHNFNIEDSLAEATDKLFSRVNNPIKIFINSPGGAALETLSVVGAIESSKTPVVTIALGKAYSGAFMILLAGHRRYAQKYSSIMWHEIRGGTHGPQQQMQEYMDDGDRMQKVFDTIIKGRTKVTQAMLSDVYKHKKDWYLNSKEAKKLGIIDEII